MADYDSKTSKVKSSTQQNLRKNASKFAQIGVYLW
jgi:hypothetical protein